MMMPSQVVAVDVEDLKPLQIQVAVEGLGEHIVEGY
jgi:hypothetical protein